MLDLADLQATNTDPYDQDTASLLLAVAAGIVESPDLLGLTDEDTWVLNEVQSMLEANPWVLPAVLDAPMSSASPLLPPPRSPHLKTLVLDLDGTLIGSSACKDAEGVAQPEYSYDSKHVWLRPGVREFLEAVKPFFEIVLFTAATSDWAARALEVLDPDNTLFDHRLYREHTVPVPGWNWVKDLSRLGRDLSRVVIVDDNELMFQSQPCNAIWVEAFEPQSQQDDVLGQVMQLLLFMVLPAEDVTCCLANLLGIRVQAQQAATLQLALLASSAMLDTPSLEELHVSVPADAAPTTADVDDMAPSLDFDIAADDTAVQPDQVVELSDVGVKALKDTEAADQVQSPSVLELTSMDVTTAFELADDQLADNKPLTAADQTCVDAAPSVVCDLQAVVPATQATEAEVMLAQDVAACALEPPAANGGSPTETFIAPAVVLDDGADLLPARTPSLKRRRRSSQPDNYEDEIEAFLLQECFCLGAEDIACAPCASPCAE